MQPTDSSFNLSFFSPEPLGMHMVYCGTVYTDKETLPAAAFELLRNPATNRQDEHLRREVKTPYKDTFVLNVFHRCIHTHYRALTKTIGCLVTNAMYMCMKVSGWGDQHIFRPRVHAVLFTLPKEVQDEDPRDENDLCTSD